jgi:peptidyl-Lys metalloendopeptidase
MGHPQIQATIDTRGAFRMAIVFRNTSGRDAHLYRPNACEAGRIENNVFIVRAGNENVAYTGAYVKRPAPRPQDFVTLRPGEAREEIVDLASAYAVEPGSRYTVRYDAYHGSPGDPDALWGLQSNTVTIGGAR